MASPEGSPWLRTSKQESRTTMQADFKKREQPQDMADDLSRDGNGKRSIPVVRLDESKSPDPPMHHPPE